MTMQSTFLSVTVMLFSTTNAQSVCVTGNDHTALNGVYAYYSFDYDRNTAIYYCSECWWSPYLYGLIMSDNTFYWRIGPDSDEPEGAWSSCYVGSNLNSEAKGSIYSYTFNLDDCYTWYTYIDSAWVLDTDLSTTTCTPTPTTMSWTPSPTTTTTTTTTASWTPSPTMEPTLSPTSNILIQNAADTSSERIAFNLTNEDLSCGGWIDNVAISDSALYKDEWVNYTTNNGTSYEFSGAIKPFSIPITIRIIRGYTDEDDESDQKFLEILTAERLIYSLEPGMLFDFDDNFCDASGNQVSVTKEKTAIDYTFYYALTAITLLFFIVGVLALCDAKCAARRNDYFLLPALLTTLLHVLDVWSDVFNSVNFASMYSVTGNGQFLIICLLSVVFIILPIIASMVQLHHASSKYWLYDNRMREWLLSYSKLLYFVSVITGSSFAAIELFNSSLFGLDVFYMGITRQYLLGFTAKQVYSIVLLENTPQLILSIWYLVVLQQFDLIPVVSILFSVISIVVTIVAMVLQKRIYKTQEYAHITIDVTGECVMNRLSVCKNRINETKTFLCHSVLGVNEKSVEIQKPFDGDIRNGVRLHIHVAYVVADSEVNPADCYDDLLQAAVDNQSLQKVLKEQWKLSTLPQIENIECRFSNLQGNDNVHEKNADGNGEQKQMVPKQASVPVVLRVNESSESLNEQPEGDMTEQWTTSTKGNDAVYISYV